MVVVFGVGVVVVVVVVVEAVSLLERNKGAYADDWNDCKPLVVRCTITFLFTVKA